jgi:hypothetical protein
MLEMIVQNPPTQGTNALERLVTSFGETFGALGTFVSFADQIDGTRRIALEALAKNKPDGSEYAKIWISMQNETSGPARKELARFSAYNNRLCYQSAYNAFFTFIIDIMKEIYYKNNNMLNLKSTLTFREIIRFSRMKDLIDYMVEKRVSDLSYQSVEDLNAELKDKISFELFESKIRMITIVRISERRNLITHNNAIVDHRYVERTKDFRRKVGEKVYLHNGVDLMMYLLKIAVNIDNRARLKFNLRAKKFRPGVANA